MIDSTVFHLEGILSNGSETMSTEPKGDARHAIVKPTADGGTLQCGDHGCVCAMLKVLESRLVALEEAKAAVEAAKEA